MLSSQSWKMAKWVTTLQTGFPPALLWGPRFTVIFDCFWTLGLPGFCENHSPQGHIPHSPHSEPWPLLLFSEMPAFWFCSSKRAASASSLPCSMQISRQLMNAHRIPTVITWSSGKVWSKPLRVLPGAVLPRVLLQMSLSAPDLGQTDSPGNFLDCLWNFREVSQSH